MGEIVFVGLGLNDEMGISLRGLEEVKTADHVFVELYTSLIPEFSATHLKKLCGKDLTLLSRGDLEERDGQVIINVAENGKAVLLVPGDPLIATTHVTLRLQAEKKMIATRIVHGASVLSAVIGLSGLHSYKFGKSVTIPFPEDTFSKTPYKTIEQNKELDLHTLCLLDLNAEKEHYMTIPEALGLLRKLEKSEKKGAVTVDTLAVGVARAGSSSPEVRADSVRRLLLHDFGSPPHTLIIPGKLHFTESEALIVLAKASPKLIEALP